MGRVEETNKALIELKDTVIKLIGSASDKFVVIGNLLTCQTGVNEEIAKSLAQLADDIHFIKETMDKEKEDEEKWSTLTCADCKYSDVIDHMNTGFVTRFNVEFCRCRGEEISFQDTPICDRFKQKEEEAES